MWRAFVYGNKDFGTEELVKQSYSTFAPLDGKFDNNVILQVSAHIPDCFMPGLSMCVMRCYTVATLEVSCFSLLSRVSLTDQEWTNGLSNT